MTQGKLATALREKAAEVPVQLTAEMAAKLVHYAELVMRFSKRLNLTGAKHIDTFVLELIVDCLHQIPLFPKRASLSVIDVGSGGGLPAIPYAVVRPDWVFTLVERMQRRTDFLRLSASQLGLPNVTVSTNDAGSYNPGELADIGTARAVADTETLLGWLEPLLRPSGLVILPRGEDGQEPPQHKEFRLRQHHTYQLKPHDNLRHVLVYQKH